MLPITSELLEKKHLNPFTWFLEENNSLSLFVNNQPLLEN